MLSFYIRGGALGTEKEMVSKECSRVTPRIRVYGKGAL